MEAAVALMLVLATFQAVAGIALFRFGTIDRPTRAVLSAILFLNAVVSVFEAAARAPGAGIAARIALDAIDAWTSPLLLLLLFARRSGLRSRLAFACYVWGTLHATFVILAPGIARILVVDALVRAAPYYLLLGTVVYMFGQAADDLRWIALAFAPRAVFFATQVILSPNIAWVMTLEGAVNVLAMGAMAVLTGVGVIRLLATGVPPSRSAALAAVGFAPLLVMVGRLSQEGPLVDTTVNYATLAIARPLILLHGLAGPVLGRTLAATTMSSGLGVVVLLLSELAWPGPPAVDLLLAIAGVLLTFILVDRFLRSPSVMPHEAKLRHWQRALLHLRSSSDPSAVPRMEWTQGGLAKLLGVKVQRVAEIAQRYSEPRTRPTHRPALIRRHVGAVPGEQGPRVYYRLTPEGEEIATELSKGAGHRSN